MEPFHLPVHRIKALHSLAPAAHIRQRQAARWLGEQPDGTAFLNALARDGFFTAVERP